MSSSTSSTNNPTPQPPWYVFSQLLLAFVYLICIMEHVVEMVSSRDVSLCPNIYPGMEMLTPKSRIVERHRRHKRLPPERSPHPRQPSRRLDRRRRRGPEQRLRRPQRSHPLFRRRAQRRLETAPHNCLRELGRGRIRACRLDGVGRGIPALALLCRNRVPKRRRRCAGSAV